MTDKPLVLEHDPSLASALADGMGLPYPVAVLLVQRGLVDREQIHRFFHPVLFDMYSPFLMLNMIQAVERLRLAIAAGEKTAIFADSDIDGLTSLTLLDGLLRRAGVPLCHSYPEGGDHYGLSESHVRNFAVQGATLLITVDCGIRDHAAVLLARELGIDVIVCDHHQPREDGVLPGAIVVDPHQAGCGYPFASLAGVAVAFKMGFALMQSYLPFYNKKLFFIRQVRDDQAAQIVLLKNGIVEDAGLTIDDLVPDEDAVFIDCGNASGIFEQRKIASFLDLQAMFGGKSIDVVLSSYGVLRPGSETLAEMAPALQNLLMLRESPKLQSFLDTALPLVALGTIADIMPLLDENRVLVAEGLRRMNACPLPAVKTLLDSARVTTPDVDTMAWKICPLLNAPGRLGRTALTADFLLSREHGDEHDELFRLLNAANRERRKLVDNELDRICAELDGTPLSPLLHVPLEEIPDGLAGLLASRLADRFKRPVLVTIDADPATPMIKGSGRSWAGYPLLKIAEPFSGCCERFGGHDQAFGFSISRAQLPEFVAAVQEAVTEYPCGTGPVDNVDCELEVHQLTADLFEHLDRCAPFGQANKKPLFLLKDVLPEQYSAFGREQNHGKYSLASGAIEIIGWKMADEMREFFAKKTALSMIVRLEKESYQGLARFRVYIERMPGS